MEKKIPGERIERVKREREREMNKWINGLVYRRIDVYIGKWINGQVDSQIDE